MISERLHATFYAVGYRTEIDGLRAIAVLSVLLFHFFPSKLPSGFLGVDLFFVISGYVITNQLQKSIENGSFSFREFYKRRVKRILPLTFVVTTITLLAAGIILLHPDFQAAGRSAFATSTFWANVYFWRDGGYFGGADKLKPLLHMWSLAVEEQFYIIYPALLWLLASRFRTPALTMVLVLAVLTFASLAAHLLLVRIGGGGPSFFLMPTRAWQFGIGALAALVTGYQALGKSASVSSIALIALLFFLLLSDLPFTSQLGVTFATGAYLVFGGDQNVVDRLLASPAMRYLGERSFSIYLWHWPIVAFSYYSSLGQIPFAWKLAGIALTFVLSEASYRIVERPFRYTFGLRASLGLISICGALMVTIYHVETSNPEDDLESRIASQIQTNFRCAITDYVPYGASRACRLKSGTAERNVAILGNSHSQMYAPAIVSVYAESDKAVTLIPLNGCTPTTGINITAGCAADAQTNLNAVMADEDIGVVFVGTTYEHNQLVLADGTKVDDPNGSKFANALIELVDSIEAGGKEVRLIGPILTPGYDFPSEISRKLRFGILSESDARRAFAVPRTDYQVRFGRTVALLIERLGPKLIRTDETMCDVNQCRFADEAGSYFADTNHIGAHGVTRVRPAFAAN